jgi:hypothetical protein
MNAIRAAENSLLPEVQIGDRVEHPQYGRGQIAAIYRNGTEWLVRFENNLRFRRPRTEFNGQQAKPMPLTIPQIQVEPPMSHTQFEARQMVEALRMGIAPAQHIQALTIGLADERAALTSGLTQAHQRGGATYAVVGDYGLGKSHVVELVAQEALARDFVVATVSLDLLELPAHRAFDLYSALMRSVRYPDNDERGLEPLLQKARALPALAQQLHDLAPLDPDPLAVTLAAFNTTTSTRGRNAWINWLVAGQRSKGMSQNLPKGVKLPSLYKSGNNARQITYLLSSMSALARLASYSGLCLLVDEAESYSLLSATQRAKASQFFSAIIAATQDEQQTRIQAETLPQHRWRDYPLRHSDRQSLFFLFTVTHSDNRMPLEEWLAPEQIIELTSHYTPQEIGNFLQHVLQYHAQAYGYTPDERHGQIRRGAAEHLAAGIRSERLSVRGVVRLAVELFDLLYLYPDYDVTTMLDELRNQIR